MNWLEQTVAEFGQRAGIDGLALGPGGFVQLALGQGGQLGLAHADGVVKVWLIRPLGHGERSAMERALVHCDFRSRSPFPTRAGLRGEDELVLLALVPEREFTTPALEQVIDHLTRLHERVRFG